MADAPQTWHYGLVARWWAEFNTDGPEIGCFQSWIERSGTPALDAACGTGRLLIPYLKAGLEVDGCDLSADMLALCQARAEREGLHPRLYRQALHEVDLPRRYRTIVVCGAFGLGATRQQDQEALERFFRYLEPGGRLVLDAHLPYGDEDEWRYWTKEARAELPEPWPEGRRQRKMAANGDDIELRGRIAAFDPVDQLLTREIQAILWRDGVIERQEQYTLLERQYFRHDLQIMLTAAGFAEIEVFDEYSDAPATTDSSVVVFAARR